MKNTISFLLLMFLVFLLACGDDAPTESAGTSLSGTVVDKATQQPVSGAEISLGEQETTSDASGSYKISNVPTVKQVLRAEKADYAVFIEDVTPVKGENILNIELETHSAYCQRVTSVVYQGKTYNTVLIGNQCWFKKNLNAGTQIDEEQNMENNAKLEKYCYEDRTQNCDEFGALYQWNEAMNWISAFSNQGICPDGWHIPSRQEFVTLMAYVDDDGNKLKAVGQGNVDGDKPEGEGTDESGFSALLGGSMAEDHPSPDWTVIYSFTAFWSSTELGLDNAHYLALYDLSPNISLNDRPKSWAKAIRCLKD